jgi:hypothetical protein
MDSPATKSCYNMWHCSIDAIKEENTMTHIYAYPSVYAIGHKAIEGIFNDDVIVEEKIDGSQFSFGVLDGNLVCRSKGAELIVDAPEKMFTKAIETAKRLSATLRPEWIYRAEFLAKPKHNTLAYNRTPKDNLIIFDICPGLESYLSPEEKRQEAERLGLECVSLLFVGKVESIIQFRAFLELASVLGGNKIEGVVIKNYSSFTKDKTIAIGKFVSETFKEIHGGKWRKENPTSTDIITELIIRYRTPARWQKAVNHLREAGTLLGSPQDIGALIREVPDDVKKECEEEIKQALFDYAWSKIRRGITAGLPEWYKDELAKSAFES